VQVKASLNNGMAMGENRQDVLRCVAIFIILDIQHSIQKSTLMAKVNSIIEFSGTLGGMTFVHSNTYRNHVRKKRRRGPVNDAFKKSAAELQKATPYAKLIKDCINPYVDNFKDGTLWSRLRSFFRKQCREGSVDYKALEGFQFHEKHSLDYLLHGTLVLTASADKDALTISIQQHGHPFFPLSYINAYRLTLVVIAIAAKRKTPQTTEHLLPVRRLEDNPQTETVLKIPVVNKNSPFIIVLKCEGYKDDLPMNNIRGQGMAVMQVVQR
jgi:hypothetical protein